MIVRLTLSQIVPAIRDLVPRLADAYPWPTLPNAEHLAQTWRHLESTGNARTYALYLNDALHGLFLGLVVPDMITGELQGLEYMWFVTPEVRGTGEGVKLLRQFEADCREAKCVRVLTGNAMWLNPDEMAERYNRLGYTAHSRVWSKELN